MMKREFIIGYLGALLLVSASNVFAQDIVDIEIKKFLFTPAEVTVTQGTTVRWTNREKRQYHNVWFEALGEEEPDYLFPEESYERVFEDKGSFPYRCGPHPEMQGVVHVE
ncbi:MAG: plastocyanin/azurin family copper-binding protein [Pseudomonadota bacterium]